MQHVVIVGGRVTGAAAYIQLVTRLQSGSRITIVDPADPVHPAVFGDPAPQLLTNTSAHIGSVIDDRPGDFLAFLPRHLDPHAVPRRQVGHYAVSRLDEFRRIAQDRGIYTLDVCGSVTEIHRSGDGYLVRTAQGDVVEATDIVLAMGPGPGRQIDGVGSVSPYPASKLLEQEPERALVLGMGPSGIDAALVLATAGIPVHMVSRAGCFPAVRSRTLRFEAIPAPQGVRTLSLRTVLEERARAWGSALRVEEPPRPGDQAMSRLAQDIDATMNEETPWQDALADVVYLLGEQSLRLTDDPKFVWRYLTSIMRSTAVWLRDLINQGLVTTGPIEDVKPRQFPLVVSAVGFEPHPLLASHNCLVIGSRSGLKPITSLDDGLRITLPGRASAERIWAIGPTAGLARITSSSLCVAVAQAAEVAKQIASVGACEPALHSLVH